MGSEKGGSFSRKGTYVYLWLSHADVWQKPAQYCKATILQLKILRNRYNLYSYGYMLLYLKWIAKKDLLYSMWNSAQCYMAA